MTIYPAKQVLIALLLVKKVFILAKYSDFAMSSLKSQQMYFQNKPEQINMQLN